MVRSLLLALVTVLGGCGVETPYVVLQLDCGHGIPCGDVYTKDLLHDSTVTIEVLREYVLAKKLSQKLHNTPFKQEDDGRGDIDDLMRGLMMVRKLHSINPIFALALSIHESGWGTSRQGREKHNLWGWNSGYCTAVNRCGDSFNQATGFGSYSNGFNTVFRKIKRNYLSDGGNYYHNCNDAQRVSCVGGDIKQAEACGASLAGMNCKYAEDNNWAKLIRNHMNDITAYINKHAAPASSCAVAVR